MRRMRSLVQGESFNNQIWLLEHPPVYTLGTTPQILAMFLNPGDIPVIQTDRGGEVTFHGPGQLVIYFLLDIKQKKIGPKDTGSKLTKPYSKHSSTLLH